MSIAEYKSRAIILYSFVLPREYLVIMVRVQSYDFHWYPMTGFAGATLLAVA
jgi:hypothetical protein